MYGANDLVSPDEAVAHGAAIMATLLTGSEDAKVCACVRACVCARVRTSLSLRVCVCVWPKIGCSFKNKNAQP